jgi:hypothetical protein
MDRNILINPISQTLKLKIESIFGLLVLSTGELVHLHRGIAKSIYFCEHKFMKLRFLIYFWLEKIKKKFCILFFFYIY